MVHNIGMENDTCEEDHLLIGHNFFQVFEYIHFVHPQCFLKKERFLNSPNILFLLLHLSILIIQVLYRMFPKEFIYPYHYLIK
jgi:hypothetical protein